MQRKRSYLYNIILALFLGGLVQFSFADEMSCDYSSYAEEVSYWQQAYVQTYKELIASENYISSLTLDDDAELANDSDNIISIQDNTEDSTEITVFYYDSNNQYNWYDLR